MKAKEPPKKIYLSAIDLEEVGHFLTESNDRDDVEYIRKDAFIDKVTKWINEHTSLSEKLVIENFVNYMKGE